MPALFTHHIFAEEVYKIIHNVKFEERHIPTENLRMQSGGTIVSSLHNYEMYDNLLTKLNGACEYIRKFKSWTCIHYTIVST